MCGRFTLTSPAAVLAELFRLAAPPALEPRYNIAPSQSVAAVRRRPGRERELVWLRWGLIPSWAKEPTVGHRMINARAETVADKPAFRAPLRRRRCLILADGFYEWQAVDGAKQPFHIHLRDRRPFALAGLWDHWQGEDGELVESCTILTTAANPLLRPLHDRMPVILAPPDHPLWIDPGVQDPEAVLPLLGPYPPAEMAFERVGRWVNNPHHDDPTCLLPPA